MKCKKCKKCQNILIKGTDYCGKKLCKKCYQHEYITSTWKKNKKYREEQTTRILKWQKENQETVKKYYQNRKQRSV